VPARRWAASASRSGRTSPPAPLPSSCRARGSAREVVEQVDVGASATEIERVAEAERRELARRERRYRGDRPLPELAGTSVILVDDGLATGATMRASVRALEQEGPEHVVVAVPVAAPETCDAFRDQVDDVVCAVTPEPFYAVGLWYADFAQTTDEEVHALLERAREWADIPAAGETQ